MSEDKKIRKKDHVFAAGIFSWGSGVCCASGAGHLGCYRLAGMFATGRRTQNPNPTNGNRKGKRKPMRAGPKNGRGTSTRRECGFPSGPPPPKPMCSKRAGAKNRFKYPFLVLREQGGLILLKGGWFTPGGG